MTGAFVATAAVGVLQLLQQTVGAFEPRPVISTLIVAAVFLAGLALDRLRVRRTEDVRAQQLQRLLVVWPPRPLRPDDCLWLGTFPQRRDLDGDRPYVARDVDDPLRTAIDDGEVVLVCGPPRAGKSRTAFEAAREAARSAHVIAPRGPEALAQLLMFDPPLEVRGRRLVWLDGLERYAEMLDPSTLDDLRDLGAPQADGDGLRGGRRRRAPPAIVVATIREDEWKALLATSGAGGETARALAARARVFRLQAQLADAELETAQRLYPTASFGAGIGGALASTGDEAGEPTVPKRPSEDHLRRTPAQRDRMFAVPAAGVLGALAAIGLVWGLAGFSVPKTPSISDQIAAIKRAGSRGGRMAKVPVAGPIDLHGSGAESYLFDFADRPGSIPRSDTLQIWDRHGDRLVRRLSFQPENQLATFELASVADVDGDGAAEVVGGYALRTSRNVIVPFAVDWDDEARRYSLVALDRPPPALSETALEQPFRVPERQYHAVYAKPVTFVDRRSRLSFTGHPVQEFIVTKPERVVAAYFLQPPLDAANDVATLELHASILSKTAGGPHLRPCELDGRQPAHVSYEWGKRDLLKVIAGAWRAASKDRTCS